MNAKALVTLEFDKVLDMLAAVCQTEGAAEYARRLTPSSDIEKVMKKQRQTTDSKTLIGLKGLPSFGRVKDIRESVGGRRRTRCCLSGNCWTARPC